MGRKHEPQHAEVVALSGHDVRPYDVDRDARTDGHEQTEWSFEKLAEKGQLDEPLEEVPA